MVFLVLPSPLLPSTAYAGLAGALSRHGAAQVASAELAPGQDAGDLISRWANLPGPDTVLVAHSNAGYLAPAARDRGDAATPILFVDAALPLEPGPSRLAPTQFHEFLASLPTDGGLLPPWTQWWPPDVMEHVIPTGRYAELDAACPRLPLTYFDYWVEPRDWAEQPNAYLAFGDTYEAELSMAVQHNWPHARISGGHLHFLHDPETVAAHIVQLAAELDRAG